MIISRLFSHHCAANFKKECTITRLFTSRRQTLRDIHPNRNLLDHLDRYHLGYCSKRRRRVAIAKKFGNTAGGMKPVIEYLRAKDRPYPFRVPGKPILEMSTADEIVLTDEKMNIPSEFAIIGRSNAGKSTLLNSMLGYDSSYVQKSEVSDKPGDTRKLHFFGLGKSKNKPVESTIENSNSNNNYQKKPKFSISEHVALLEKFSLVGVDMPGYGFAYMSDEDRLRCDKLCENYLRFRGKKLKRVLLVLDARHGFKLTDRVFFRDLIMSCNNQKERQQQGDTRESSRGSDEMKMSVNEFLRSSDIHWTLQVVLTKADLVERSLLAKQILLVNQEISEILPGLTGMLPVITVSGKEGTGVIQLQRELSSLVPPLVLMPNSTSASERKSWTSRKSETARSMRRWGVTVGGERGSRGEQPRTIPPPTNARILMRYRQNQQIRSMKVKRA